VLIFLFQSRWLDAVWRSRMVERKTMKVREWAMTRGNLFYALVFSGYTLVHAYRLLEEKDLTKKLSIWERLHRWISTPFLEVTFKSRDEGSIIDEETIIKRVRINGSDPIVIRWKDKRKLVKETTKPSDVLGSGTFKPGTIFKCYVIRT